MSEASQEAQKIRLFVSCHKQGIHFPKNSLLVPIHVGAALSQVTLDGVQRDDEGDSISEKNKSYCELTGQYWAWKNTDADYYGFLHYRRYFNFTEHELPIHHEPFIFGDVVFEHNDDATLRQIGFEEENMRKVIEAHDFIAPTPIETPDHATVYEQYCTSVGHHIEDLDTCLAIIRTDFPQIWRSAKKYLSQTKVYACNMFVMRKDLFNDYCNFLFSVLAKHEQLRDISHYTAVGRRVSGYLGERLCGIYLQYLYDSGYNGIDLQRVYFRDPGEHSDGAVGSKAVTANGGVQPSLRLSHTTRGTGKSYSLVSVDDSLRPCHLVATAKNEKGNSLPVKIIKTQWGNVLVAALILGKQTVTIQAKKGKRVLLSQDFVLHPERIKRESRLHTLRHDPLAMNIRRCDEKMMLNDVQVVIDQISADVDGSDIVHGHVSIPQVGLHSDPHEFVEINVMGNSGVPFGITDWVCMGDRIEDEKELPGLRVRTVSYSVKVPTGSTFYIQASFPDSDAADGFQYCDVAMATRLRAQWNAMTEPACKAPSYDSWFRSQHRASAEEIEMQRHIHFDVEPTYSIIVPLYKTPISFFRDMANSVLRQSYPRWELVLVNASPEDDALRGQVASLCEHDKRVRCVELSENKGITLNTNEGITAATGDFLCFLDHDDFLEPDALYRYTLAINDRPDTDMLYCDEDKFDNGRYREPFFKTEWNPDLLIGMNYVCHFLTVRKSIVDSLTLPEAEYDGSQDWHMTFRVGEKARHVCHVPKVLYHWRVHKNSTAQNAEQKEYTLDSSKLAVETHLQRLGIKGEVVESPIAPRRFLVKYDLAPFAKHPQQKEDTAKDIDVTYGEPFVSIVIPNKDSVKVLHRCLMSIRKLTTYHHYEIVVVENNSSEEETFQYYRDIEKADERIHVVYDRDVEGFNFSQIVNFGVKNSHGDYIVLLNNDTEIITPEWIQELLGPCTREDVGVTGAKLLFPDDTIQHVGITCGPSGPGHLYYQMPYRNTGNFEETIVAHDVAAVTGACMMVSRKLYDAVGGYDEDLAVNYNDVDFCLRVQKAGKLVAVCPTAMLRHYESVSRGPETEGAKALRFQRERGQFMERWPEAFNVKTAPMANPNLVFGNIYQILDTFQPKRVQW
ncbi:DUF4422 domain-containing protein [Pseudoscardovia suis]|uniref:Glycosyl transferase family 2 n=1 Tax=Pseudoscardovia suis TaxID=987063 RepID=A0A261EX27_9BIFI|nr:DUF4422 domain-containing protein [Pseudoscardovia suis]OZG51412.1 glycosyl transferase family 2 [Pseudoscardovia suis]PJJ68705.1 GT2 family glycosyltransferase [Pseudoscardovia suis]